MTVSTRIDLEVDCDYGECAEFAWPLYRQLDKGDYGLMSVAPIPADIDAWLFEHRTARKRSARCSKRGYRFVLVRPEERNDEIHAINTSTDRRQGRPMSQGYRDRPTYTADPTYPCVRHGVRRYGVEAPDGCLVAYLWLYRAGELALISQILGHAAHLENEVMYLLWAGMIACESAEPDGFIVYNRHDSGTEGLRFYKERVGLEETAVEWEG